MPDQQWMGNGLAGVVVKDKRVLLGDLIGEKDKEFNKRLPYLTAGDRDRHDIN